MNRSSKPTRLFKRGTALLAIPLALLTILPQSAGAGKPSTPKVKVQQLIGAMHEHSAYSDGWPGTRPADYYASGKSFGLDFLAGSEHSDNTDIPFTVSDGCLDPVRVVQCPGPEGGAHNPADSLRKWEATLEQARAATTADFTGIRGFEWTSDRYGHINVYYSKNDANAKTDGGYAATMETFWKWFTDSPELGGGSDGLATFNHPGDKEIVEDAIRAAGQSQTDPSKDWEDFRFVPEADDRMVGIEMYNRQNEYGAKGPPEGYYVRALDKGWHVGAIGAEDLHGQPEEDGDWGAPRWAKTIILAPDRSEASLRKAMLARRFYAVAGDFDFNNTADGDHNDLRLDFTVDGNLMGSRLARPNGSKLKLRASVTSADPTIDRSGLQIEVVTSGIDPVTGRNRIVASGTGSIDVALKARYSDPYYFIRVQNAAGRYVAYSSPVWVSIAAPSAPAGEWLAGDLHIHTCYSHDAYCPPDDFNTAPEDFWTLSGTVDERFLEASARGLDFLAITDHHSDDHPEESGAHSVNDPGFGTHGVIGVPGYENSIGGHAQMLGFKWESFVSGTAVAGAYNAGDMQAAAINRMADTLRADGGVFQANHPADGLATPLDANCSDTSGLHWRYGFDVRVDTVEVWNISHQLQPPLPGGTSNEDATRYWECWLQRGNRVAATGGSDSHWLSTALIQGPGNPTTWVFARERSVGGILQALKEGRTSISVTPPAEGAVQLLLEADINRDGLYESMIGDTVPPNTPMRVRATGLPGPSMVQVRANGATLLSEDNTVLLPAGEVRFAAPANPGWVRATLLQPDAAAQRAGTCDSIVGLQTTYCRNHVLVTALTSAIYLALPVETKDPPGASAIAASTGDQAESVDSESQFAGTFAASGSVGLLLLLGLLVLHRRKARTL